MILYASDRGPSCVWHAGRGRIQGLGNVDDVEQLGLDVLREACRSPKSISVNRDVPTAKLLRGTEAVLQLDDNLLEQVPRMRADRP